MAPLPRTPEEHAALLTELNRQRAEREARESRERQEAAEAPLRERALKAAKGPVDFTRYRNERNLMLFPFCSTAKAKRVKGIRYVSANGQRWLEVTANHDYGMAKIWDFDILRFALSKAGEIALQVSYFPPYVEFTVYECLKALKRSHQGWSYRWIKNALRRLTSTTYCGNIFREDDKTEVCFTLISFEYKKAKHSKNDAIRLNFDQRLIESVRFSQGLLTINPEVLHEEAGIKKRLLELVTVSKGKESSWMVNIERLQAMCAHEGELKEFKRQLKGYKLPWEVSFSKTVDTDENVTFKSKTATPATGEYPIDH